MVRNWRTPLTSCFVGVIITTEQETQTWVVLSCFLSQPLRFISVVYCGVLQGGEEASSCPGAELGTITQHVTAMSLVLSASFQCILFVVFAHSWAAWSFTRWASVGCISLCSHLESCFQVIFSLVFVCPTVTTCLHNSLAIIFTSSVFSKPAVV